jgi:HAD superfamily hydrolase (TIGR01509 family)
MSAVQRSGSDSLQILDLDRVQGVIFDVDGTLYDQGALRRKMLQRIVSAHWIRPLRLVRVMRALQAYRKAHEDLRNQVYSADSHLALAAAKCGYTAAEMRLTVGQWFDRAPLDLLSACVHSGLPQFLTLLSELRIHCGVFSDYPVGDKLSAMGLRQFFSHVLCAADVGRQKPDPTGILAVARQMGFAPERMLYIGDRSIDLEAAAGAGMQGIRVRSSKSYSILYDRFASRRAKGYVEKTQVSNVPNQQIT